MKYTDTMTLIKQDPLTFLKDRTFFTKDGKKIEFLCTFIQPQIEADDVLSTCKSFHAIEAFIDSKPAGYILLAHIDKQTQEQFFPTVLDWIVLQSGNSEIKKQWLQKPEKCISFLQQLLDTQAQTLNEIEQYVLKEQHYLGIRYQVFIDYWINKPNVEFSCVYNHEDKKYKTFQEFPFIHEVRDDITNYRGQGIAQALYAVSGLWMQSKNLYLYSSSNQTSDGKKIWSVLENLPNFQILATSYLSTLTNNRKNLIKKDRQQLYVK